MTAAVLSAAAAACTPPPPDPQVHEALRTRELHGPVPAIQVKGRDGRESLISDWFGDSLTVLNVWAEWCIPCLHEIPALIEFDADWRARGVNLVSITAASKDSQRLATVIENTGITYPVLEGGTFEWAWRHFRVEALPTTLFIDGDGMLRRLYRGAMSKDLLDRATSELLQRSNAPADPVTPVTRSLEPR